VLDDTLTTARAAFAELPDEHLRHRDRTEGVGLERGADRLHRDAFDDREQAAAGVVHQRVDRRDRVDEAGDAVGVGVPPTQYRRAEGTRASA
jgi:hypothetical protein